MSQPHWRSGVGLADGLRRFCEAQTLRAFAVSLITWLASSAGAFAQSAWTPPVPLTDASTQPRVQIDGAGNSIAAWTDASGPKASLYAVSAGAWSPAVPLRPVGRVSPPELVMTSGGRAIAAWTYLGPAGSTAVRTEYATFSSQSREWSAALLLADGFRLWGLAIDASGNAMAAVARVLPAGATEFAVARFDAGSGSWGAPVGLRVTGQSTTMDVVMSAGGDAFAVFYDLSFNGGPSVVRYQRTTDTWQSPVSFGVCDSSSCQGGLAVAMDASGRALAVWANSVAGTGVSTKTSLYENGAWTALPDLPYAEQTRAAFAGGRAVVSLFDRPAAVIRGATLDLARRAWTAPAEIGATGTLRPSGGPGGVLLWDMVMNETGQGFLIWDVFVPGVSHRIISVARFAALTSLWSPSSTLTQAGTSPTIAIAASGAAIAGWNDLAGSSPTFSVSRFTIGSATPVLAPAVVNRPNVAFTWTPPTSGAAPSSYTLIASLSAGGPPAAQLPMGTQTSVVVPAPDGTFYVKVVATVSGSAVVSNEIRVDVTPPSLPGAPQQFTATVAGSVVSLAWQAPADNGGTPIAGYVLEAGSVAGASDLARLAIGASTSFVSPAIPDGSYFLRVRAVSAVGAGVAAPEVRAVVGPPPPAAPTLSGGASGGGTVSLSWTVPGAGAPPTGYQLVVGSAPGLGNAATLDLPVTATSFAVGGVPAGTYYVRVLANSAVGLGSASNELMVVVP